jgi:hypothetical protein
MLYRCTTAAIALALALLTAIPAARAFDESKYPDLKGKWERDRAPRWVPAGETAPLTAEYQAIFDANLADQALGGHGTEPSFACLPPGMPRIMLVYEPMEIVVTPWTTYMLISHIHDNRRIFTDGRDWPAQIEPTFHGYSIGNWIDEDGDGRYDVLEVETRGMKGPRAYDTTGLPLHSDNQTVVKERLYLDKADAKVLYNEITTTDHALTRPWTVKKRYLRSADARPAWLEETCAESNAHVVIGKEAYFLSADGLLMPAKKNQPPPDLRYFNLPQK